MKVIVRQHRPLRSALLGVLAVVAVAALGWSVWNRDQADVLAEIEQLTAAASALRAENAQLLDANEDLTRRLSLAQRTSQVEAQAYANVGEHLSALKQ